MHKFYLDFWRVTHKPGVAKQTKQIICFSDGKVVNYNLTSENLHSGS
ncbi:MAG: hypothetical protein F6K22_12100 [Okeania sp. SIO2F4]|nr:hypothetical protein [Okeania sp. SIO2F4]NES03522.1 hypothetical protein [Okeania sp. SIO2F4]